jgi:fermentation-respiration switch protein FrsA (DUF1100 family)
MKERTATSPSRIALLMILLSLLMSGCSSLFFYPQKPLYENSVARRFSPEDIWFKTDGNLTLHGWFFRAAEAKSSILVLHGNAQNLGTHINSVLWLVPAGFNVFIFDYRGYGNSEGNASLDGVHKDAEAALETLLSLPGVDQNRVFVLGQSIGGSIAVYLAATTTHRKNIRALIVESAFASYRQIAREKMNSVWLTWPFQYPFSYLFSDNYSAIRWIRNVSPIPILILHGQDDDVVPMHHGMQLYEAALQPKEFWMTNTHGHISSFADPQVRDDLVHYLTDRKAIP